MNLRTKGGTEEYENMTQLVVRRALVAATVLTMWGIPALAQTPTADPRTYPTLSEARPEPPPAPAPEPEPPQAAAAPPPRPLLPPPVPPHTYMPWIASGFVGSSFGTTVNVLAETQNIDDNVGANWTYGGQIGYLWHGVIGGEFLADFAPHVGFDNPVLLEDPRVHSYMANVIGAYPLGADGRYQPYISGGFGSIGMSADVFASLINGNVVTVSTNQKQWGSDIGGGIMAFADRWGVRGDIRYFRASTDNTFGSDNSTEEDVTQALLSDLRFWRGTVGLSFRW